MDIKQIYSAPKRLLLHLDCGKHAFDGSFFEFPESSRKGHRFFIGVFRNYQLYFAIKPECPGAYKLSDAPAFCFQKFII